MYLYVTQRTFWTLAKKKIFTENADAYVIHHLWSIHDTATLHLPWRGIIWALYQIKMTPRARGVWIHCSVCLEHNFKVSQNSLSSMEQARWVVAAFISTDSTLYNKWNTQSSAGCTLRGPLCWEKLTPYNYHWVRWWYNDLYCTG